MATNLNALKSAIKLLADAGADSIKAASDKTTAAKIGEYQNLIGDVLNLLPQIGDIPSELKALSAEDYATLLAELAADLAIVGGKIEAVAEAAIKLIADLSKIILPEVEALVAALKA